METKICAKCKNRFYLTDFYKHSGYKDGYNSICKTCVLQYDKARAAKCIKKTSGNKKCSSCNIEKDVSEFTVRLRSSDGLRNRCKECDNQAKKIYVKKNPNQRFLARLRQKYGLNPNEYQEMLEKQDYKCKICNKVKKLVIDHCHESGKIRSLLCPQCNTGIGMFFESEQFLLNAIDYLRLFNDK